MPQLPPPPRTRSAYVAPPQTRVRWDNIAIAGAGLAVVLGIATTLFSLGSSNDDAQLGMSTPRTNGGAQVHQNAVTPTTDATTSQANSSDTNGTSDADANDDYVTDPADAASVVDDARDFISQGRWDEAQASLDSVAPQLRQSTGATDVSAQLQTTRGKWNDLDRALRSDVAAMNWSAAKSDLAHLAAIAPLDDDQLALRDEVAAGTAPHPAQQASVPKAAHTAAAPARAAAPATATPAARPQQAAPASATPAATSAASDAGLTAAQNAQINKLLGAVTTMASSVGS